MDYVTFLEKLQSLPKDKQAAVFDFVDFLSSRYPGKTLAESPLAVFIQNPFFVDDITPMSRQEANER